MNVDGLPLSSVLMIALTVVMLLFLIFSPKPSVLVCAKVNDKSTAKAGAGASDKVGDKASADDKVSEKVGEKADSKANSNNHRISEEEKIRNLRARIKGVRVQRNVPILSFPSLTLQPLPVCNVLPHRSIV